MRGVGIVAFVLAGVALVLAPLISDHIRLETAARVLAQRRDLTAIDMGPEMDQGYRWGCWLGGAFQLLIRALFSAESARGSRGSEDHETLPGRA
jgi:hypothetical protein